MSIQAVINQIPMTEVTKPENTEGLPYVTHEGKLKIGDIEIDVVQLNTGERLITEESLARILNPTSTTGEGR